MDDRYPIYGIIGVNEKHITRVIYLYNNLIQYHQLDYTEALMRFVKSGNEVVIFKTKREKDTDLEDIAFVGNILDTVISTKYTFVLTKAEMGKLNDIFKKLKNKQ